eukprot:scaffold88377_cov39-Phaeocystis_antarctica.AAC.2
MLHPYTAHGVARLVAHAAHRVANLRQELLDHHGRVVRVGRQRERGSLLLLPRRVRAIPPKGLPRK